MNSAQLLDHFDRISEAPDAIPRLRDLILDLAVRGRVVEQNSADEPGSELLKRLHVEGHSLIRENSGRRTTQPTEDLGGANDFQIPRTWARHSFGDLLDLQYRKALSAAVREDGPVPVYGSNGIVGRHSSALAVSPAIIIGRKGSAGALNIAEGPSWTTDVAYFLVAPPCYSLRFLFILLTTLRLDFLSRGVKPGLNRAEAYALSIVVPPFAEQHRIVAKVDELMALCDRFEAAQAERERRRDRLTAASLNRLNRPSAETPAFREDVRFQLDHFPRVFTRQQHVEQLRRTILSLAIRGDLVAQDSNDEAAGDVIKCSRTEKERVVKERKIKTSQPMPPVFGVDVPFQLSPGWTWGRIEDLFTSVTDGDHLPPPKTQTGVPFLVIGNVRSQQIDFTGCRYVSEDYYNALDDIHRPRKGDVLYTLVGSYGIPVLVTEDRPFCVQRHIGILRPSKCIDRGFFVRALESQFVFDQATKCATGIAQKTVPLSGLRRMLLPVPPLAEQRRIAAKDSPCPWLQPQWRPLAR